MRNKEIFDSWKDIAVYLGRDIRTCFRWEKELGLPVHRIDSESLRSKVFAYKSEIDQWLQEKANSKELKKRPLLENRKIIIGLISALIVISTVFAVLYFTHLKTTAPSEENLSIAVLPLNNINSLKHDKYFSEGITNVLINKLSLLDTVEVTPWSSVSRYRGNSISPRKIGEELGIRYILTGDLEKTQNKIRLRVQLMRVEDGKNIWDREFEEPPQRVLSVLNSICFYICKNLKIGNDQELPLKFNRDTSQNYRAFDNYLKGNYILSKFNDDNSDPWGLYYQGKYYWGTNDRGTNELAINLFNQAIEIDNDFIPAYLGLAYCYIHYVNFNWEFNVNWLDKAEDLVKKAQSLYPEFYEYFSILIEINLLKYAYFNKNTKNIALDLAQEGIKKHPNHPQLNSIVGYCYYLKYGEGGDESDFDKALKYKKKSFKLNPYAIGNIVYAELLMLNKKFKDAIQVCNIIKKYDSSLMADYLLGEIYYYSGDLDKSKVAFQEFETPFQFKIGSQFYQGMIASQKGEVEEVKKIIQKISIISPDEYKFFEAHLKLASIYMGIGEKDLGYKHLRSFSKNAILKKHLHIFNKYIEIDKNFDRCRKESKFNEIIKKEIS